jgi:hypothetical protein
VGITEQRAISSNASADGIGIAGAMAHSREWWGLRSGARGVRRCFKKDEVIRPYSAARHVLGFWRFPDLLHGSNVTTCR